MINIMNIMNRRVGTKENLIKLIENMWMEEFENEYNLKWTVKKYNGELTVDYRKHREVRAYIHMGMDDMLKMNKKELIPKIKHVLGVCLLSILDMATGADLQSISLNGVPHVIDSDRSYKNVLGEIDSTDVICSCLDIEEMIKKDSPDVCHIGNLWDSSSNAVFFNLGGLKACIKTTTWPGGFTYGLSMIMAMCDVKIGPPYADIIDAHS